MYGELGLKLTQHAKRTLTLPNLPPYAPELVRSITHEVRALDRDVTALLAPYTGSGTPFNPNDDRATATSVLVDHLCMRRNKRCLLAYHRVRCERLEQLCWEGREDVELLGDAAGGSAGAGAGVADGQPGQAGRESTALSPEEEEYLRRFGDLLAALKGHWTDIDLAGSLEPPRDLFIDVRVLKDAGEIQTEYGAIRLTKNSQFFVRGTDVERLIQQGYLQKLG